jgi:hypothetical protein
MAQNGPATPSRLHTHSRQISEGATEFGTPESNFPPEADNAGSPSLGESTRMVGLGISRQGSVVSANGADEGDVFGGSRSKVSSEVAGRDAALDEVDQFLQDEEEGDTFDLNHGDRSTRSKSKFEFNMPRRNDSSHSSLRSHRSHASDPLLEVLDNDDDWEDEDEGDGMEVLDGDDDDEDYETGGAGRRSRRGRRRWNEDEGNGEAGLLEVSPMLCSVNETDR